MPAGGLALAVGSGGAVGVEGGEHVPLCHRAGEAGKTQAQMARLLGAAQNTVSVWLDTTNITFGQLGRVYVVLKPGGCGISRVASLYVLGFCGPLWYWRGISRSALP